MCFLSFVWMFELLHLKHKRHSTLCSKITIRCSNEVEDLFDSWQLECTDMTTYYGKLVEDMLILILTYGSLDSLPFICILNLPPEVTQPSRYV